MADILLYLCDNYLVTNRVPDPESLSRKLSAAGFEAEDIRLALDWLYGLKALAAGAGAGAGQGLRCYTREERQRLDPAGIGFLIHLENLGLLSAELRESVIQEALALDEDEDVVSAELIKSITMLTISYHKGPNEAMWLEDMVHDGNFAPTYH